MGERMPHITPAELEVMKVLWKLGSGTVRQVLDASTGRQEAPAYTTVMTMLKNLAEKNALRVDRERQPFVYTPHVRKDQVLRQRLSHFVQTVFDGRAEDLVLRLVEETSLTAGDLRRIEAKIEASEGGEGGASSPSKEKG